MSTVQEIEEAVQRLPASEREAFEARLLARRAGLIDLPEEEHAALLQSLDEAEREIDSGRSHTGEELRKALDALTGK